MLDFVDPPKQPTMHQVMSADLQAALGAIQQGAEEGLEMLKDKKWKLKTGEVEMKPVLGHIEYEEGDDSSKIEKHEPDEGNEGEIPCKWRVMQSVAALKDARRRENIAKQEQCWIELTEGQKGSRASASAGAPTKMTATSTVTSTSSSTVTSTSETMATKTATATATVSSTVDVEPVVDLEEAMMSQGNEDDDTYSKKYKMTSEHRTDRGVAHAKQKEERERKEREWKAMEYAERQLQQQIEERQKQMLEQALLAQEEKAVEERCRKTEEREKVRLERKTTELEKYRERERIRKEKQSKKRKEEEKDDEEDAPMIDDTDKDKDYDPDEDPEA